MLMMAKNFAMLGGGGGSGTAIIGVAVASGSKTHTRIDADGNTLSGAQYNLGGAYYDAHGAFALSSETIDGQAMIRVPAVWYKRATLAAGAHSGKEAWWVADGPAPGFTLHPAFMGAGAAIGNFWIGKYQGTNDSDSKVGSVSGVTPLVSVNIGTFASRCAARNTGGQSGFMMWSIYQLAVIQMLAMIESASTDSQAAIGQGRVSQTSAANVDAADVAQASYRGVVGLWGNVYQWIDGLKTVSGVINVWDRDGNKTWVSTGQSRNVSGNGPLTMSSNSGAGYELSDLFIANTLAGSEAASTWPDHVYFSNASDFFSTIGGGWGSTALAGLWFLACAYSSSSANTNFGGRLAKV